MDSKRLERSVDTAEKVAVKIARKAAETCAPLQLEMELSKWPAEFRKIMWDAVAHHAEVKANEAALNETTS